jgi:hypothetical protein
VDGEVGRLVAVEPELSGQWPEDHLTALVLGRREGGRRVLLLHRRKAGVTLELPFQDSFPELE